MGDKRTFHQHIHRKAEGSTADVLQFPQASGVHRSERWHVTLLSYMDEDNAPTSVQVSVRRETDRYRVVDNASVSAGVVYALDDEIVLTEGEQLEVYFNGATSGDDLHMWPHGFYVIIE